MKTREAMVFLITPNDNQHPSCLVYADSMEDARASCTSPATLVAPNQKAPKLIEGNPYTDVNLSGCVVLIAEVSSDREWNDGEMIDYDYKGKIYALQKNIPEYL